MISTTAPKRTALFAVYPNNFEANNSSAGRMRLPPPSRRYSPISVMTATSETASRSNSRSMASRSSRNRSNTSFTAALALAGVVTLVGPVVGELHIDAEIPVLERRDHLLQSIAIFAGDADGVALDGSLHLELRVFDELRNVSGF